MSAGYFGQRLKTLCPQCGGSGKDAKGRNCGCCLGHGYPTARGEFHFRWTGQPVPHRRDLPPTKHWLAYL